MRVSQAEKERSRERIVEAAARLLRERGIEGASVADVMNQAGLTHGGFYRHFATKEALLEAALGAAFQDIVAPIEDGLAERPPATVATQFRQFYLSQGHLENPGIGCPAAALSSEVARASDSTKRIFAKHLRQTLSAMARTRTGDASTREAEAIRDLAMMVGALTIARACDPDTAAMILSACRAE